MDEAVTFKVWATIERVDDRGEGIFNDVGQVACVGYFDNFPEAAEFVGRICADGGPVHYDNCPHITYVAEGQLKAPCICGEVDSDEV